MKIETKRQGRDVNINLTLEKPEIESMKQGLVAYYVLRRAFVTYNFTVALSEDLQREISV